MSTIYDYQGNPIDLSISGNVATPLMFGAKGDGVTDDTNAFQLMEASAYNSIFIPEGVYRISSFETQKSVIMDDDAWITTSSYHTEVVVISGDDNVYKLNLRLGGQVPHWGVDVEGDNNHFLSIRIDGMDYDNNGANAGVMIRGSNNTFDFIRFNDFIRRSDPSANDSCPQGVSFLDNPTNNFIAVIQGFNCKAAVVNAANHGTKNKIGILSTVNCSDNTLYCVRGGFMDVGTIIHGGNNEAVAVITDTATVDTPISDLTTVNIGTLMTSTDFEFVIRLKNAGRVSIGSVIVNGEIQSLVFVNTENVKSGEIYLGDVYIYGSVGFLTFLPDSRGTIEALTINNLNVRDNHKKSKVDLSSSDYMIANGVKRLEIGSYRLIMLDAEGTFSNGTIIRHNLNPNCQIASEITGIRCDLDSVFASADFINSAQEKLRVEGGVFQNDSALTTKYTNADISDAKRTTALPTNGYWMVGDTLVKNDGTAIYVCTQSGEPGTWRTL